MALSDIFPPAPPFTPRDLPSQSGRVFIITGATGGVGLALATILYSAGGTVYIGGRSAASTAAAIATIKSNTKTQGQELDATKNKTAPGTLEPFILDLADFTSIKPAVVGFLARESRLDVLVHNAGVMVPPKRSVGAQGHDLEMATHALGPFLLTTLLTPILQVTASLPLSDSSSTSTPYATRVIFIATLLGKFGVPVPAGGMELDAGGAPVVQSVAMENYVQSKIAAVWLAAAFAKRLNGGASTSPDHKPSNGILSLSVHPGFLKTELQKNLPTPARFVLGLVFKAPIWGAYTELFAGFSLDLGKEDNGSHVVAWGRRAALPQEVEQGMEDGRKSEPFWVYCEKETRQFL